VYLTIIIKTTTTTIIIIIIIVIIIIVITIKLMIEKRSKGRIENEKKKLLCVFYFC